MQFKSKKMGHLLNLLREPLPDGVGGADRFELHRKIKDGI